MAIFITAPTDLPDPGKVESLSKSNFSSASFNDSSGVNDFVESVPRTRAMVFFQICSMPSFPRGENLTANVTRERAAGSNDDTRLLLIKSEPGEMDRNTFCEPQSIVKCSQINFDTCLQMFPTSVKVLPS